MSFVDPQTVLNEARDFADQRRYEEALERHIWFHDHALEHDRAWCGVRLSFALADWVLLGELHPPARQALVEIRDRTADAMRAGDWSPKLFSDVASINHYLGQEGETGVLFLDLHRADPMQSEQFYRDAEAGLFTRGLFAVCAAHLPDASARFEELRVQRRSLLSNANIPSSEHMEIFRAVVEKRFAEEVIRLLTILTAVGRTDETEQVRSNALAETENAEAREIIEATVC